MCSCFLICCYQCEISIKEIFVFCGIIIIIIESRALMLTESNDDPKRDNVLKYIRDVLERNGEGGC